MSPKKPKEFLFKQKGWCFKGYSTRDSINREKGIIYLSHTHLRIAFENGGERIIPVNEIEYLSTKRIFFKDSMRLYISTDTGETYTFFARDSTKKLYSLLSELVTNLLLSEIVADLPDGKSAHVGPILRSISRSSDGAFVGFGVGLVGGIIIVFMIIQNRIPSGSSWQYTVTIIAKIIINTGIWVIPVVLPILGAIIGYFFGKKIYKFIVDLIY